jgi:hypothetical protein
MKVETVSHTICTYHALRLSVLRHDHPIVLGCKQHYLTITAVVDRDIVGLGPNLREQIPLDEKCGVLICTEVKTDHHMKVHDHSEHFREFIDHNVEDLNRPPTEDERSTMLSEMAEHVITERMSSNKDLGASVDAFLEELLRRR